MQAGTAAAAVVDNSTAKGRKLVSVSWTAGRSRMPVVGLRRLCCDIDKVRLEEKIRLEEGEERVLGEARIVNSHCHCYCC